MVKIFLFIIIISDLFKFIYLFERCHSPTLWCTYLSIYMKKWNSTTFFFFFFKVGIAFIGVGSASSSMVRLVLCPHGGGRNPAASRAATWVSGTCKASSEGWGGAGSGAEATQVALGRSAVSPETGRKPPGRGHRGGRSHRSPTIPSLAPGWSAQELDCGESPRRVSLPPQIWGPGAGVGEGHWRHLLGAEAWGLGTVSVGVEGAGSTACQGPAGSVHRTLLFPEIPPLFTPPIIFPMAESLF